MRIFRQIFILSLCLLFSQTGAAFSMQGVQTSTMRLGLGLASLAVKECEGYRIGKGMEKIYLVLKAKTQEQRTKVTALAEKDAQSFLRAQGKDICEVAKGMAQPGALLEKI